MIAVVTTYLALPMISVAIILAFIRLVLGPSLPDRVIALDLLMLLGVGMIVITALVHREAHLFDLAIVLSLITFLGTVAFARYLEKAAR